VRESGVGALVYVRAGVWKNLCVFLGGCVFSSGSKCVCACVYSHSVVFVAMNCWKCVCSGVRVCLSLCMCVFVYVGV